MEVPVQCLEATFERESVDLWICGGSVVMESRGVLGGARCQARERSTLPLIGLRREIEIENMEDSF